MQCAHGRSSAFRRRKGVTEGNLIAEGKGEEQEGEGEGEGRSNSSCSHFLGHHREH